MSDFNNNVSSLPTKPKEPEAVTAVKQAFNQYFSTTGNRSFRQFYYDWHIDAMIEPFAELAEYFERKYPENASEKFAEFVKEFGEGIQTYNVDCEKFCSMKSKISHKDRELSKIVDKIETFAFQFRQFSYSMMSQDDHSGEFGNWFCKPNYPYSHMHGLAVSFDILNHLSSQYKDFNPSNVAEQARFSVDTYLRDNIAKDYAYKGAYTYRYRKAAIKNFVNLRDRMADEYRTGQYRDYVDLFQIETMARTSFGKYRPNGFELEFYVPEEYGDYAKLIEYLKEKHGWKHVYTTNKDPSVYDDGQAAGVIERDESLAAITGLAPVEYASRIMKSKSDEAECLMIMDSFDKGYANVHCSLHQHISAEGFDLDTYKRLIKRMMLHEADIVGSFAAPERRNNRLLYATYISRNLSSNGTRDYPFLCVVTDICENLPELREMVGFGHKYKTLNIMPSHTVEFRYMNANFNKEFVEAFLQFNRDFVNSAIANSGTHINRPLLHKYNWRQNVANDNRTVLKDLSYYYQTAYDQFRPERTVTPHIIHEEQVYARHVTDALGKTGKSGYYNSWFIKRVRDAKNR